MKVALGIWVSALCIWSSATAVKYTIRPVAQEPDTEDDVPAYRTYRYQPQTSHPSSTYEKPQTEPKKRRIYFVAAASRYPRPEYRVQPYRQESHLKYDSAYEKEPEPVVHYQPRKVSHYEPEEHHPAPEYYTEEPKYPPPKKSSEHQEPEAVGYYQVHYDPEQQHPKKVEVEELVPDYEVAKQAEAPVNHRQYRQSEEPRYGIEPGKAPFEPEQPGKNRKSSVKRDHRLPLYFTMYEKRVIQDPMDKYGKGPWRYLTYGHGITYGSKDPGKVFERGYGYIRALGRDHCKLAKHLCPRTEEKPFEYDGRKEPYFGYRPH